jgi:hypothetical protein
VAKVILLVIAGIVALNVALLAGAALVAVLDRRRRKRDIRDLEQIWQLSPRWPVAAGRVRMEAPRRPSAAGHAGSQGPRPSTASGHPRIAATLHPSRSSGSRRLVGVTLVAALAVAGTASASPHARDVVGDVFTSVTRGLGLGGGHEDRASIGVGSSVEATPSERMPRDLRSSTAGTGGRSGASSSSSSSSSSASGSAVDAGGSTITDPGVAPLASTTVTASPATSSTVNLVWTDIAGESGYRVERSADGASGWTTAASLPENSTTATDTGLAATTTYYYRVIATTKGGDASVSDVISTTTLLDPPAAPTMIAVPVSSTGIDLSWTDVGTESGYRIEVSLDGGATWDQAGTQGADVTTFSDTGLAPATTYWYRVIAFNAAGDSAPSEPVSTTTDPAPTTPSDPPSVAPAA